LKAKELFEKFWRLPEKQFHVSETEWYDRILFALDYLSQRPDVKECKRLIEGTVVTYIGDHPMIYKLFLNHTQTVSQEQDATEWIYAFSDVKDPEYLRRLNEYPDETPQAELEAPFAIICENVRSLIAINASGLPA